MAVDMMKDAMGPSVRFVRLKARMLEQRSVFLERRSALLEKMSDAIHLRDVQDLVPQLDAVEAEIEQASTPIALAC